MPGLHARYRIDPVVNVCTFLFALGLIAMAFTIHLWLAAIILVFLGVNWVIIPTNFNTATQKSVPPWVKGRAISWYLTVLFGSFAIGGALWGRVTTATSMKTSLLIGGTSMALMLLLAKWFPLTLNEGLDLTPAYKPGQAPADGVQVDGHGPVEVTVEYEVDPARREEFLAIAHRVARQRRRNGASHWHLKHAEGHRYVETFRFASRAEYVRQPGRLTKTDLTLHDQLRAMHAGDAAPVTRASTSPHATDCCRLGTLFDTACDRAFTELINGVARVRGVPDRARPRDYI
jgi:hypothetical protein